MPPSPGETDRENEDSGTGMPGILSDLPLRKDAPRPATILKCADLLEARGGEVLELFREVTTPNDSAVFPIHFLNGDEEFFVEVETGQWVPSVVRATIRRAAILRSSTRQDAGLGVLSAYPVPDEVLFLIGKSPAALLALDLFGTGKEDPTNASEVFRESAGSRWGTDLECSTEYLPLVEELLLSAFEPEDVFVTEGLVYGLGCFLGETIRLGVMDGKVGMWSRDPDFEEGIVLEVGDYALDPVGKARAFLENGEADSLSFYAGYVMDALGVGEKPEIQDESQE